MKATGCAFIRVTPWFTRSCDKSEWYDSRGAFIENHEAECRKVVDAGHELCPRHELFVATVELPMRWKCQCGATYKVHPQVCGECGEMDLFELPVGIDEEI